MVSAPAMTSARMIGEGLAKSFVSWWLGVRKNLEHHTGFTHYHNMNRCFRVVLISVLFENLEDSTQLSDFIDWFLGVTLQQARAILEHVANILEPARDAVGVANRIGEF